MHLITFGTDEHMLDQNSRQHARLCSYVWLTESYTALIFSKQREFRIIEKGNLTLLQIPKKSLFSSLFKAYRFLKKQLKAGTLISAQDPFEVGLIAYIFSRFLHVPLHAQIHTAIQSEVAQTESLRARIQYRLFCFLLRRIDSFRVVSKAIKNFLIQKGVSEKKIFISPVIEQVSGQVRQGVYTGGTIEILCVARFVFFKNLPTLIDAFADFSKQTPSHLTIVGGGPLKHTLTAQVERLGLKEKVTLLDWVPDITELYNKTDLYIQPSYYEGFGMAIVEAIHFGIPVIVTPDVGSVDYVNSANGFVTKGYTKENIIEGLDHGLTQLIHKNPKDISASLSIISKEDNDMIQKESFEYSLQKQLHR